jgi:hypothetical protein
MEAAARNSRTAASCFDGKGYAGCQNGYSRHFILPMEEE